MVTHGRPSWLLVFAVIRLSLPGWSAISTSTPTPPLQWLNITRLLNGPGAPPLKGASIGYDETTRTLLVFGGESESGFPTSTTYLLNLDSLIWSVPTPPTGLDSTPPPRSSPVSGFDWAANQRQCHIVVGGRGSDGNALTDVWEYDFLTQFWASVTLSPGGPSGRWGAAGGNDQRVSYLPTSGLNNSFYLAGGQDESSIFPLSDVWRLNVSGTLSPNNPNQVFGSWESLSIPALASIQGPAGTVISQQIISSSGCRATTPANNNNTCAVGDSFIINTSSRSSISPASCPAPRYEGVMVANMNGASSSFSSQVFLLLGTFNSNMWDDAGGLSKGEIAILDTSTGSWARILPAGDPDSVSPYPSPRSGATAITYQQALIGQPRTVASDTIVFGGQDATGKYISEVWLLRAYNGVIKTSGDRSWGGFGNGQLQSGSNASGAGVTNTYMDACATQLGPDVPSPSTTSRGPSPTSNGNPNAVVTNSYNVSIIHKILAPLSVALVLPAILVQRLSSPPLKSSLESSPGPSLVPILLIPAFSAFGLGIAGLISSFTSISYDPSLNKRAELPLYLRTRHGVAGVVLAAAFYVGVPIVFLSFLFMRHLSENRNLFSRDEPEKLTARSPVPSTLILDGTLDHPPSFSHSRSQSSTGLLQFWKRSMDRSRSSDTDGDEFGARDPPSPRQTRGFEVVNRPKSTQRASSHSTSGLIDHGPGRRGGHIPMRLGEISWLSRRRMVNTVGELDYALTQIPRTADAATSNTADGVLNGESVGHAHGFPLPPIDYPSPLEVTFRMIFHILLLGLCGLCLSQLWHRSPVVAFVVFLVWTMGFYTAFLVLAWYGRPRRSILTVTLSRLRARPHPHQTNHLPQADSRPISSATPEPSVPFAPDSRGPYLHSPPFRAANEDESYDMMSTSRPYEDGEDDPDDGEDEETRQRRIEDEMNRRDVSIVTVPKRKLWIANPS